MQLRDDGLNRSAIVTSSSKRSALCFWRAQESKTSKGYRQFEGETALVFKWNLSRRSSDGVSKMTAGEDQCPRQCKAPRSADPPVGKMMIFQDIPKDGPGGTCSLEELYALASRKTDFSAERAEYKCSRRA